MLAFADVAPTACYEIYAAWKEGDGELARLKQERITKAAATGCERTRHSGLEVWDGFEWILRRSCTFAAVAFDSCPEDRSRAGFDGCEKLKIRTTKISFATFASMGSRGLRIMPGEVAEISGFQFGEVGESAINL